MVATGGYLQDKKTDHGSAQPCCFRQTARRLRQQRAMLSAITGFSFQNSCLMLFIAKIVSDPDIVHAHLQP